MKKPTKQQIIEAADRLFYEHGFENTSFADIACAVKISRGNFYYHFKTKDEILTAVIEHRLASTKSMLDDWEKAGDCPEKRIGCFIEILITNQTKIMNHGCPVGTLTSELAKLEHGARPEAGKVFSLFRDWLARQFSALGHPQEADKLALHLLARSQGVATLMNVFGDETFMREEIRQMKAWIHSLAEQPATSGTFPETRTQLPEQA